MASSDRSILIDARVNALPGAHGLARSVMKLAGHMAQEGDGLALRVLVRARRPQLFPLAGLPPHAEIIETDIGLAAVHRCLELARLIRAAGAGVLYVPYATFTPFIRPCPIVVTIHDCTIESDVHYAGGWPRQAGLKLATRTVLRRAAAVTAPTRASLEQIRQHYPGAPVPTLVPNGVDAGQFAGVRAADVAAARERYRLPGRFVLTVGAHRPHKNQQTLVRALALLPPDVSLVIVGCVDTSFADPVPRLVSQLGLAGRVRLVPEVTDELLPAVYRAASVFAFPSLAEGYGLPVLEAMAAGVPVVASDIPVLAEVAGQAAMPVPPLDVPGWAKALGTVLAGDPVAARLARAGVAACAAAGWEHGAAALRGLLASVARGEDPGSLRRRLDPGGRISAHR